MSPTPPEPATGGPGGGGLGGGGHSDGDPGGGGPTGGSGGGGPGGGGQSDGGPGDGGGQRDGGPQGGGGRSDGESDDPVLRPGLRAVPGPVADVVERVRRRGVDPGLIGPVASKPRLLAALGAELGFPDWVGANWDALYDILQNLYWRPDGPQVVVWVGPERLRDADPDVYAMALRVLRDCVAASLRTPRPLTILLTPEE